MMIRLGVLLVDPSKVVLVEPEVSALGIPPRILLSTGDWSTPRISFSEIEAALDAASKTP